MPRVSVLMPVYNGEAYLQEAIDSILKQEFTDFEFVIINDGSTDHTAEIIQSYDDPRIRYFENEQNIGLVGSLNSGLKLVQSPYIARMDADDISMPKRFANQVDFLDAHPKVGVLGSAVKVIDGDGNSSNIRRFPENHELITWSMFFDDPIAHPTVMMRRELLKRVRGYRADMLQAGDYDLWRRLSKVTRFSNLPNVLLFLRRHDTCITKVHRTQQLNNSIRISHTMISEILGDNVPLGIVQNLWSKEFERLSDMHQAGNLIYRLYRASTPGNILSSNEKRMIQRDASIRLLNLFLQKPHSVFTWYVVALAFRVDPFLVSKLTVRRFLKLFSLQPHDSLS